MIHIFRRSIKARFIIITVSIVMTVVVVLTCVTAWTSARLLKEESERQLSQSLSQSLEMLSGFMNAREVSLEIWSSNPLVDAVFGDPALAMVFVPSLREYFSKIREKEPWISNIFLIQQDAVVYDDSDAFEFSEGSDGSSEGTKRLISLPDKGIVVVNLNQFNRKLNKNVILIKRNIVKKGTAENGNFIVLILDPEIMNSRLFGNIRIGNRGFISIAAESLSGDIAIAKSGQSGIEEECFSEIREQWKRFSDIPDHCGSIILRKQIIPDYPLAVIGLASLDDIREPVSYLVFLSVIFSLLASSFGIWSAVFFSGKLISPIFKLIHTIGLISKGDMTQRVDVDRQDEIGTLATAFNEMTERLQANHLALQETEKKYRSIFENAVEGIFQSEPDGRIIRANPAFARIMGYESPDSLILSHAGITDRSYLNPEHRGEIRRIIDREGRIMGFETQLFRKDNSTIWVSVSARSVSDIDGNVLYFEGSITDITEHKEKEKAEIAREIAEAANKKIMESIHYAKMIQRSLLTDPDEIRTYLPDSFFIWEPRDIVGGDIFFTEKLGDGFIIAVVDCTGHGVPGAFMTMIASSGLRKIIRDEGCHDPAEILKRLSYFVKTTLHQDKTYAVSDDGMDIGIARAVHINIESPSFGFQASELIFAGAKLSLFYVCNGEVTVIAGDRQSIGYKRSDLNFNFSDHKVRIEKGTVFYMASDGFTDQLGADSRRFGSRRFRELLKRTAHLPFERQREILLEAFEAHKGDRQRQDDVTVAGFGF